MRRVRGNRVGKINSVLSDRNLPSRRNIRNTDVSTVHQKVELMDKGRLQSKIENQVYKLSLLG